MKKSGKITLIIISVIVLSIILFIGYLGYIPGLSTLLGANKPRNLGIKYTENDKASARAKSQLIYGVLPENTPPELSISRSGSRKINTSFNSAELTSLMNNRPWKYWPIEKVQLRINDDGSTELSGVVINEKLKGYAAAIGVPAKASELITKFLPRNPAFYVKAKTSLTENQVSEFDVQSVYLGKVPIPVNALLAKFAPELIKTVFADDVISELSKYEGKKEAIINFINELRMEKAKELLLSSDYSNELIAEKIGFTNAPYFSCSSISTIEI